MRKINIAIAGIGGVGRRVAELLYARQQHYARVYGVDVRLVGICGSRAGLARPNGLSVSDFDELIPGHCGPEFLLGTQPDVLIEAGPTDIRTGQPGADYIGRAWRKAILVKISKDGIQPQNF